MTVEPDSEDPRATTTEDSGDDPGVRPDADPDRNAWTGPVLAVVLVGTLVLGLLRPFYPTVSALGLGVFLALFGVFVGVLALRERAQGS